jgi:peroxiredoxin
MTISREGPWSPPARKEVAMQRLLALTLVVMLPVVGVFADEEKKSEPRKAPAFQLKDLKGKSHKLEDFKDKILVIEWTEPGCPYIVKHAAAGTMKSIAKDYAKKDVVFIGICTSSRTDTKGMASFAEKHGIDYTVLMDETGSVGRAYGASNTPHMYIVKGGKIVYEGAIDDDPRMQKDDDTNYIRKALDELIEGKAVSTPKTKPYG